MTISNADTVAGPFVGNGVTTTFAFTFKVFSTSDVQVVRAEADTLAETVLTLNSHYSIVLNANQEVSPGGTVTYPLTGGPMPATQLLTLVSVVPYTQTLDLTQGGGFFPESVETAFDRAVRLVQQVRENIGRAVVFPVSSTADPALPVVVPGQALGWGPSGTLTNIPLGVGTNLADLAAFDGDGLVGTQQGGGDVRTVGAKIKQLKTIEDYYKTTDLGNMSLAVGRWAATNSHQLLLPEGEVYNFDTTIDLRDRTVPINIRGVGVQSTALHLRGANDVLFDVGGTSAVRFHFWLDNVVITKENQSSAGSALRLRNLWFWGLSNVRAFCDNKFWRFIDGYNLGFGESHHCRIENTRKDWIYLSGGGATPGVVDGLSVGNVFRTFICDGNHSATASAFPDQGGILCDAYVAATVLDYFGAYRHKGYAAYFKGTSGSVASNVLNLVNNPNVEATNDQSGVLRVDYHVDGQMGGGTAWGEGNNTPAVWLTANSVAWRIEGKLGLKNGASIGVKDEGTNNEFAFTAQGYNTDAGLGGKAFVCGTTATGSWLKSLKAFQLLNAVENLSTDVSGNVFENITYRQMNGAALVGLGGVSNHVIEDVTEMGASTFVASATTIAVPAGHESVTVTGTTAIDEITGGYRGQRVTLNLANATASVRDTTTTGKNIVLKTSGVSLVAASGRENVTLERRGDGLWWEVGRTA